MLDDTACTTGVSNGSAPGDVPVHGQLGSLVTTQFPCGACDRASAIKFSSNGPARTLSIPLCECTWLNKSLSRPAVRVRLVRLSGDSVPLAWVHLWERSATQPARLRAVCGLFTKGQLGGCRVVFGPTPATTGHLCVCAANCDRGAALKADPSSSKVYAVAAWECYSDTSPPAY